MNAASENVRINRFYRVYRWPLFIGAALLLSACGRDRPAATPVSPTAPVIISTPQTVVTVPAVQNTLPPTFTPVPTPTPLPTRTPTKTATITPTLTAQQVCDNFSLVLVPANNKPYDYEATVGFGWQGVPDGASVALTISQSGQGVVSRVSMPVSGDSVLTVPLVSLPGEGQYDWDLWLQDPRYGQICAHRGSFTREPMPFM